MSDQSLKIYIEALLERSKTTTNINNQIKEIQNNINKINVDLNIDTKLLDSFKKQFDQIEKQTKQTRKNIEKEFQQTKGDIIAFKSIDDAIKKYEKLGTVVSKPIFDSRTKEIKAYELELKRVSGVIQKLKFSPVDQGDGKTLFELGNIHQIDKRIEVEKKSIQEIKKIRQKELEDIHSQALTENKLRDSNREKALQEEQKIRQKLAEEQQKKNDAQIKAAEKEAQVREKVLQTEQKIRVKLEQERQKELENIRKSEEQKQKIWDDAHTKSLQSQEKSLLLQDRLRNNVGSKMSVGTLNSQQGQSLLGRIDNISPATSKQELQSIGQEYQRLLKLQNDYKNNNNQIDQQIQKLNRQKINLQDGSTIESETRINRIVALMNQEIAKLEQIKQANRSLSQQEIGELQRRELAWKSYINSQKSREQLSSKYTPEEISRQQKSLNVDATNIKTRYERNVNSKDLEEVRAQINNLNNIPLSKLDNELKNIKLRLKEIQSEASETSRKFLPEMLKNLEKISSWVIGGSIFFGAIQGAQDLVANIVEIDKKLTDLSKVMSNGTDYAQLMQDAVKVSNEYGRSLHESLTALEEFGKAGLEAQDAFKMTDAALLGANALGLNVDDVSSYLTSIINQYNMATGDVRKIVDMANEIDNNYSVTAQALLQGATKAGEGAQQIGMSLQELFASVTIVQESTRESGTVIGEIVAA